MPAAVIAIVDCHYHYRMGVSDLGFEDHADTQTGRPSGELRTRPIVQNPGHPEPLRRIPEGSRSSQDLFPFGL